MQVKFIQTYVLIILLLLEFFVSMTFFVFILFCDCYAMAIPLFLGKIERHSCMQVLYR